MSLTQYHNSILNTNKSSQLLGFIWCKTLNIRFQKLPLKSELYVGFLRIMGASKLLLATLTHTHRNT